MAKPNHQPPPPPSPPPPSLLRRIIHLDTTLSHKTHTIFEPIIPRAALKLLEITGDGRLWFPLSLSLLLSPISLHSPSLYSFSLSLLLGLITDIIFIGILKHLIKRRRPQYNPSMGRTLPVDHWSFPSGHSSRVFFIASLFSLSITAVAQGIDHLRFRDRAIVDRWIGFATEHIIPRAAHGMVPDIPATVAAIKNPSSKITYDAITYKKRRN